MNLVERASGEPSLEFLYEATLVLEILPGSLENLVPKRGNAHFSLSLYLSHLRRAFFVCKQSRIAIFVIILVAIAE